MQLYDHTTMNIITFMSVTDLLYWAALLSASKMAPGVCFNSMFTDGNWFILIFH